MNTIGGYNIVNKDSLVAVDENVIKGRVYRISILSDRLVRIEYNPKGVFEDRASERVIFRKFPRVVFSVDNTETLLQVKTSMFTLNYVKDRPIVKSKMISQSNLQIILNNTDKIWCYGNPEIRNFGGINYSLDDFKGNLKQDKGFYSTDGFCLLDDSHTDLIDDNGKYVKREDKSIDLYVFMYKKDLGLCLQDYYKLTGYPFLLPRYAVGMWWYKEKRYNNKEIYDLVNNFNNDNIPLSGILLGDKSNSKLDPFSVENLDLRNLNDFLNKNNIKLGITFNPSNVIKKDSYLYNNISGMVSDFKEEYSLLPLDEERLNVLVNCGVKPYLNGNVNAFYVDYNNINDKNTLYKLNNSFYAGSGLFNNKRSFVMSRNHGIAPHRNTIIYTGDTFVDWDTLTILPRYLSSASNNGVSYIANPIGGFKGGIEDYELYIRYVQLNVFNSMFLIASDEGKYYKREPWRWNLSQKEILKKYINLRYKLIPYIYTESYMYSKNGSPLIQPLYYKYPKIYDEPLYKNQYFFGSGMLVCPITKKKNPVMNRVVQRLFIPEGIWYELESGKKYIGNKYYMSFYKDEDYPVFCKEGSIIVMSGDNTYDLPVNMEVVVFPGVSGNYQLYEDDGVTNDYKSLSYAITDYNFTYDKKSYSLKIKNNINPHLIPQRRNYKIVFKNTGMGDVNVVNGLDKLDNKVYIENNDLIIEISDVDVNKEVVINVNSDKDLLTSTMRLINDDIKGILEDLEIETVLKDKIDAILFGDLPIRKKRIAIRKLKKSKLEPKFIKMFLNLLEYIKTV